jgi:hypothetical protein
MRVPAESPRVRGRPARELAREDGWKACMTYERSRGRPTFAGMVASASRLLARTCPLIYGDHFGATRAAVRVAGIGAVTFDLHTYPAPAVIMSTSQHSPGLIALHQLPLPSSPMDVTRSVFVRNRVRLRRCLARSWATRLRFDRRSAVCRSRRGTEPSPRLPVVGRVSTRLKGLAVGIVMSVR